LFYAGVSADKQVVLVCKIRRRRQLEESDKVFPSLSSLPFQFHPTINMVKKVLCPSFEHKGLVE
jgi:hypothetical protein